MALTVDERKEATRWFLRQAFNQGLKEVCRIDAVVAYQAIAALDDALDAAPTATESTLQAEILSKLSAAFKSNTNARQKGLALVAVIRARVGE